MVLEKSPGRPEEARPDSPPEGEERVDGGKREKEEEAPRTVVRDVPGKGKGLFAARDLRMGEVVMRESPLIVMPDAVFQLEDMDRLESWLDKRVNALSSSDRAAFSALSDCRSPPDEDGEVEKTSLGIFFTNDMTFDGDAALFVHMARANHSCAPNADFVTRTRLGVQDLVATRDITAGQEITISYLPAGEEGSDVREVRQAYIREWYGFRCCCRVCTLQGDSLTKDEATRKRIKAVQSKTLDAVSLHELEEFSDNLSAIGSKLPYHLEVNRRVFQRALEEDRRLLAAKVFAASYLMDSIVNGDSSAASTSSDDDDDDNPSQWEGVLRSDLVSIAGRLHEIPRIG